MNKKPNNPIDETPYTRVPIDRSKIHTMIDDLPKDIKKVISSQKQSEDESIVIDPDQESNSESDQSPFMVISEAPQTPQKVAESVKEEQNPIEIPYTEKEKPLSSSSHSTKGVLVLAILLGVIFVGAGVGGYYYWTTRIQGTMPEEIIIEPVNPEPPKPKEKPKPTLSTSGVNVVAVDDTMPDSIMGALLEKKSVVADMEVGTIVWLQFVRPDTSATPYTAQEILQMMNVALPAESLSFFRGNPNIYIHHDSFGSRIAMDFSISDTVSFKKSLLPIEAQLPFLFKFVYLGELLPPEKSTFTSAIYSGNDIRYINFDIQGTYSFDYSITKDSLVIGTTMDTMHAYWDKRPGVKQRTTTPTP